MLPYTFFALTLAIGLSAAQSTTTVSLFLPNTDPQSLVASVIGTVSKQRLSHASLFAYPLTSILQDATATTYLISCPPGSDSNNCGYGGGATVIEGPSTLQMVIGGASIACNLAGTTQAVCTESQTLSGFSTTELVTSTLGPADITYFPVGVTAGAERLGPASTGVSATATGTSGASATTGLVGSISLAVSSTSGSGSAATTSTTELGSSNSETSMTPSATGSSSISQTQSAATTSASSAAARAGQDQLSMLTTVVKCLVGSILGITLL
jgi:hypothetical protein